MAGLIVDGNGTQDISGHEQESICVRFVNRNFDIPEEFLGLCKVSATTGEALSNMLVAYLNNIELDLANPRSQTYDGAENIAGIHKGCQLANFHHCGAHITHLVLAKSIAESK